ncbi:MAG: glycoside hydrolase family 3 N-terminal domain-containing protein, partial [Pseudomonadota bacterium]
MISAIFGCSGPELTAREAAFFAEAQPWGFILFARNVEDPDQLRRLTSDLRASVGRDAPVLIDQEGGRVQRLRSPHWREFAPAMEEGTEERLYLRYRLIAHELRSVGVDVNCAPLLDVPVPGSNDVIGGRALATYPDRVIALGHAVRKGLMDGGCAPVIKHMPGHGRSTVDTHLSMPTVTADRQALEADFAPFRAHSDCAMGMTGHLLFTAIDPETVSTFSPAVIDLIRTDIGFRGLLMTDDISMGALEGTMEQRASRALAAGVDLILHCNGEMEDMEAIA